MPKLSIVSAYYNRKDLLLRTLRSIECSKFKDFEYIIVDDGSSNGYTLETLLSTYPFIKLIRIEPQDKHHYNPCVPFNIGLKEVQGDLVIIQNPECLHVGDVLSYAVNNLKPNKYLVFSSYSLSRDSTTSLSYVDFNREPDDLEYYISKAIGGFNPTSCEGPGGRYNTWFAHPKYRQCIFNFMVALTREDLFDLGGFDESYAQGHSYDDTDLAIRVVKKGMNVEMIERPFCLHQYHDSVLNYIPNFPERLELNKSIYESKTQDTSYKPLKSRLL